MTDRRENDGYTVPRRFSSPEDEKVHSWLPMLLDAYHLIDEGIAAAIGTEKQKGRKPACTKGCSSCCKTHETIPVYPLELVGITWYVTEKITGTKRAILREQLRDHKENGSCPFLVDGACSIHEVRPISCRQFIVFGGPCSEGEDPYYTRRKDVLTPIREYVDRAFFTMLPFYGVKNESDRWKAVESGALHKVVSLMQTCKWRSLADKMDDFDRRSL